MRLLDNIPRVKSPDSAIFKKRHLLTQRPVILTDLMDGAPLDGIRTLRRARAKLGHAPLVLGDDYRWSKLKALLGPQPKPVLKELFGEPPARRRFPKYCRLDEYLNLLRRVPETTAMCFEQAAPAEVLALAAVPAYCRFNAEGRADAVVSSLYLANRGAASRLHFDIDCRHNLLYQVFGLKRVTLIPPTMSKFLMPYDNGSLLTLQEIPDAERLRLLRFLGGYDCLLRPGETLYIPPLWWHFVEYETIAMSLGFHFGRNPYNRFMTKVHKNMHAQGIAAKFLDLDRRADRRVLGAFRRLRGAYDRPARSPLEKYDRVQRLMEKLYAEICPESLQGTWWFPLQKYFTRTETRGAAGHFYGALRP